MENELNPFFIIGAYILGWFWVEKIRDYFQRRKISVGISERLRKANFKNPA